LDYPRHRRLHYPQAAKVKRIAANAALML